VATAEIITDLPGLEPIRAGWDALAVEQARPFSSPSWTLAWWRHAAPPGAELRVIVIREGDEISAVAPFFAEGRRYRLLASDASLGVEPLAAAGAEREAIKLTAAALAAAYPRPDIVELAGIRADSPWPGLLRETWPGQSLPALRRELSMPLPMLELSGLTYEDWFASKSAHFRQRARRLQRGFVERGGRVRLADGDEELARGLQEFARLHHASWRSRGGSGVLTPGVERMLPEAARELTGEGRFRLWLVEVDGQVIGAGVRLAAGGEVSNWLVGFDEGWRDVNAPMLMMLASIEDCFDRGDRRIDLGGGRAELKSRVADREDALEHYLLLPAGPRRPLVEASLLPGRLRRATAARIPPAAKARIKRALRRS
jgi:CelD/BcsL family acetyltransferase involved in cellulose biosynthesis